MSKKRKRHTEEAIYPIVEEWLKTGERKKELCQRHGIKVYILDYWLGKYRKSSASSPVRASNFIPIKISGSTLSTETMEQIEICYSDGTQVRLPVHVSMGQIRMLLPLFDKPCV